MTGTIPDTRALLRNWIDAGECLGGQVFVWRDGHVVADLAVGRSGLRRDASSDDVARLYCAIKPITACVLSRAVAAGEVGFDDPASRFLPGLSAPEGATVTLRSLLSHNSGVPDDYRIDPYDPAAGGFRDVVERACTIGLPPQGWFREPRYNDTLAWSILGVIVERLYGRDFAEVVTQEIADPAGLPGLRMTDPDPARYVTHLMPRGGTFEAIAEPAHEALFHTVNPAHGGFATARDLGLLYAELVRCAAGTGTLLGEKSIREIIRTQGDVEFGLGLGRRTVGLGFVTNLRGDAVGGNWSADSFGHAGFVGPYRVVHAFGDLDHRIAVAIRLFSVGAKNNWRFHKLGTALSRDLDLEPDELVARRTTSADA